MTSAGDVIGVGVEALVAGALGSWLMFRRLARRIGVSPAPTPTSPAVIARAVPAEVRIDKVVAPVEPAPPEPIDVPDARMPELRGLNAVVAGFEEQLRDVGFDPEAPGMTSEARRYYLQATQTEERFRYEGAGKAEFVVDRPEPGRVALLRVTKHGDDGQLTVRMVEHTLDRNKQHDEHSVYYAGIEFVLLPSAVTHLSVSEYDPDERWTIEVLTPTQASLPLTGHLTGQGSAVLRHDSGAREAVLQVRSAGNRGWSLDYYTWCEHRGAACTCRSPLKPDYEVDLSGERDFRDRITLPDKPGLLLVHSYGDTWSIDIVES